MSQTEPTANELIARLDSLPTQDDIDALRHAIQDLNQTVEDLDTGTDTDRDEIAEIARQEAMELLEHLVQPEACNTERCEDWQRDLVDLVHEMDVPEPEKDTDDSGASEEGAEEANGETDDDERGAESKVEESEVESSSDFPPSDW